MSNFRLSTDAENDVIGIYLYTLENFGVQQADRYIEGLEKRFTTLADQPTLGRRYDEVKSGTYRAEYESHSVYYRRDDNGILIFRILHQRMDPGRHII